MNARNCALTVLALTAAGQVYRNTDRCYSTKRLCPGRPFATPHAENIEATHPQEAVLGIHGKEEQ